MVFDGLNFHFWVLITVDSRAVRVQFDLFVYTVVVVFKNLDRFRWLYGPITFCGIEWRRQNHHSAALSACNALSKHKNTSNVPADAYVVVLIFGADSHGGFFRL